jgi:hypothetical protein
MAALDGAISKSIKLTSTANYSTWKFQVKNILQKEDLLEFVSEDLKTARVAAPPVDAEDGEDVVDPADTKATLALMKKRGLYQSYAYP